MLIDLAYVMASGALFKNLIASPMKRKKKEEDRMKGKIDIATYARTDRRTDKTKK